MRKYALLLVAIALASSACASELGRRVPECEAGSGTLVLAVQSVPGSEYVSCIFGLKAGWDYEDLRAVSGSSWYSLDSDRMGLGFLRVDNLTSCDVGDAVLVETIEPDIELWRDVVAEVRVFIAIVPEVLTEATSARTAELITDLADVEIEGRDLKVTTYLPDEPTETADRIEAAAADGAHVITIGVRDAEEGTLTLRLHGTSVDLQVEDLDDAIDLIDDVETEPSYRGNWYYVFDGGCVKYTFNAVGPGVATLESDIEIALSLYDAEALRQVARDEGYRIP